MAWIFSVALLPTTMAPEAGTAMLPQLPATFFLRLQLLFSSNSLFTIIYGSPWEFPHNFEFRTL